MKRMCVPLLLAAIAMHASFALGRPIDGRAARILLSLRAARDRGQGRVELSATELASVLEASEIGGEPSMAAAYALAFSDSEAGQKALDALASHKDPSVAGVAEFSLLRKQAASVRGHELLALLSFRLGNSARPWTRTLLVTTLGDEFQGAAVAVFLAALKEEKDRLVRAELIFQVACHGNRAQLKHAVSLLTQETAETADGFAESTTFFLNAASRNATERRPMVPPVFLLRERVSREPDRTGREPQVTRDNRHEDGISSP